MQRRARVLALAAELVVGEQGDDRWEIRGGGRSKGERAQIGMISETEAARSDRCYG
jgi:hypothetical protein